MHSVWLVVVGWQLIATTQSFPQPITMALRGVDSYQQVVVVVSSSTIQSTSIDITLWSVPPKRTARRDLQKRQRRRHRLVDAGGAVDPTKSKGNDDQGREMNGLLEIRPLIKSYAREQGVDYWIDEEELQKYAESIRRRPREAGQVPDEKLWQEVLSPYRENWIGLFSVFVVVIATIVVNFPELLQTPVIRLPDL